MKPITVAVIVFVVINLIPVVVIKETEYLSGSKWDFAGVNTFIITFLLFSFAGAMGVYKVIKDSEK